MKKLFFCIATAMLLTACSSQSQRQAESRYSRDLDPAFFNIECDEKHHIKGTPLSLNVFVFEDRRYTILSGSSQTGVQVLHIEPLNTQNNEVH